MNPSDKVTKVGKEGKQWEQVGMPSKLPTFTPLKKFGELHKAKEKYLTKNIINRGKQICRVNHRGVTQEKKIKILIVRQQISVVFSLKISCWYKIMLTKNV